MINGKPLQLGKHIWVIYKNKVRLGVILEAYLYGFSKVQHYKIIVPIGSRMCSVIVRAHTDKNIFESKEDAERQLEAYDKNRTRKIKFVVKKYKLQKR